MINISKVSIHILEGETLAELTNQEEILKIFYHYRLIAPTVIFEFKDSVYITDSVQLNVKDDGSLEAEIFVEFDCLIADVPRI